MRRETLTKLERLKLAAARERLKLDAAKARMIEESLVVQNGGFGQ